jgi:hypothetical protein
MKMKGPFLPSKQLLVFNGAYVLIAVVRSLHSAADFSGINLQSISFSCTGKYVATGGFYFRHAHPDVQIDLSDLDNLTTAYAVWSAAISRCVRWPTSVRRMTSGARSSGSSVNNVI